MHKPLRLLPLSLCIACALATHIPDARAADEPEPDWGLCPVDDSVPAFADAQPAVGSIEERASQPTDIACDDMSGVDGENVACKGNVTLRRGDQFLGADGLEFENETSTYVATGSVRYQDSGMRMVAERLEGDQEADTHRVENVRYQLTDRRGNGGAERIEMKGSQGALYGSTYSTCPPDDRWWELRAGRIDIDNERGQGIARNATLRVGKVPVLYVPIFAFPTDNRRHTGLLYPAISYSSRNGFDWRQPIYLNLAPNYDMTLEPRLMTNRGLQLGTEFRYLVNGGGGVLELDVLPSDNLARDGRADEIASPYPAENYRKEDRGMFRFNAYQNMGPHWQARTNLAWASDPRYLEDSSNALNGLTNFSIKSDLGLYGRGRDWDAGVMADYWQLGDWTLADANLPFHRLPRAYVNWERGVGDWLVAGVNADATRFAHADSAAQPGGSRIDVRPYVSMPLEGASWFVKPTLAWRYTGYALEDVLAQRIAAANGTSADDSPSRSLPITTIDAGMFFDRDTMFRGESYLNTLEPRLYYVNAPYRDQSNLPLFDTQFMSFGWGQLFRDNRFTGADRQADANQLTLALTTRLIESESGAEKLSASIGQIRYFEDSRVGLDATSPVIGEGKSAWIADGNYAINDRWSIGATYHWNPATRQEDLASVRTRYLMGDDGVVNLAYRYRRNAADQRDLLEQVDLSFLYPINTSWSLVGRYYYSLLDNQLLEGIAGVQWDSCCMAARLVARRYVRNRTGEMNDAIQFELEFKGLGSAGPDTASRLRRAILGYYREDLYLVPPAEVRSGPGNDPSLDATP
ncbi:MULTISPECIES: LPS assembly protein LptD [unclassified Luteimonas]|uniref:LPS assembly protein LptD n=1 Tax=unclassified Luteimonas TaxID=2629088 RepID=UPI0016002A9F|nr:LPS assembly protein LptD [Luteimonas sp. MC1825]MBB1473874.1 LPS assembly protein LptD [Luteimonas sp. MC1782]MBB6599895.1 LPS assembly protein LptD [Luteimonas sp. MC1825]QOC87607.1 LPS assembly protein LptD [Luteimonas sp. MC1825]